MILCDGDIKEEIERKRIVIEPFDEKSLTPNGYDLTIGDVRSLKTR
jgi:dCTP deaminase (EC 3.5.4.13)